MSSTFLAQMITERAANSGVPLGVRDLETIKRDIIHSLYAEAEDFKDINNLLDSYKKLLSRAIADKIITSDEGLRYQVAVTDLASQLYVNKTGHNVTVRTFMSMYSAMNSTHDLDVIKLVEQCQPRALRDICYLGTSLQERLINVFNNTDVIQSITSNLIYEHDFAFITNQSENKLADWLELLRYLELIDDFDSFVWDCRKNSQLYDKRDIELHEESKRRELSEYQRVIKVNPTPVNADEYLSRSLPFLNYTLNFRADLKGILEGKNTTNMESRKKTYLSQIQKEYDSLNQEIVENSKEALGEINEEILKLEMALKHMQEQQKLVMQHENELTSLLKEECRVAVNNLEEYCKNYEDCVLLESNKRNSLYQLDSINDSDKVIKSEDYANLINRAKELNSIASDKIEDSTNSES